MGQFNLLTQQLASQSCSLLLLSALREVHGSSQTGLAIARASPKEEVGMCGHEKGGFWEGEVGNSLLDIVQFINLSTKLHDKDDVVFPKILNKNLWQYPFLMNEIPYAAKESYSATSPKEEHQKSQFHLTQTVQWRNGDWKEKKKHQSELAIVYRQNGL